MTTSVFGGSTRRFVAGLIVVLAILASLQAVAAAVGGSTQFLLIQLSAIGMILVLGGVVYALRGGLE